MGPSDRVDAEEDSLDGWPRPERYGHPSILFQRVGAEDQQLLTGPQSPTFVRGP